MSALAPMYGVSQATPIDGAPPVSQVNAPSMSDATTAYGQALQTAMNPLFAQQQQTLAAKEASMGILSSGGAKADFTDLTGQQDASLAQAMAPLIQQGFQQSYGAATTNAGADNSYLQQLTGIAGNQQIQNASNDLNAQEFDASLSEQQAMQNQNAQNALQLAQLGYGNQTYNNEIGAYGSMLNQGAAGFNGAMQSGGNNEYAGYVGPQQWNLGPSQSAGYAAGYGSPPPGTTTTSGGDSGYGGYASYNPYPGGDVTIAPGSGEGQNPNVPVNVSGYPGEEAPAPDYAPPNYG